MCMGLGSNAEAPFMYQHNIIDKKQKTLEKIDFRLRKCSSFFCVPHMSKTPEKATKKSDEKSDGKNLLSNSNANGYNSRHNGLHFCLGSLYDEDVGIAQRGASRWIRSKPET